MSQKKVGAHKYTHLTIFVGDFETSILDAESRQYLLYCIKITTVATYNLAICR